MVIDTQPAPADNRGVTDTNQHSPAGPQPTAECEAAGELIAGAGPTDTSDAQLGIDLKAGGVVDGEQVRVEVVTTEKMTVPGTDPKHVLTPDEYVRLVVARRARALVFTGASPIEYPNRRFTNAEAERFRAGLREGIADVIDEVRRRIEGQTDAPSV